MFALRHQIMCLRKVAMLPCGCGCVCSYINALLKLFETIRHPPFRNCKASPLTCVPDSLGALLILVRWIVEASPSAWNCAGACGRV